MPILIIFALGMVAGYFLRPAINRGIKKLMDDIRNNRDED
jgi:hypothetical protein